MIQSYFQAEKQGGFIAMVLGILACSVGGGVLLSAGAPFYTGLSVPLVAIGFFQIIVGATVARRSDFQAEDLEKLLAASPAEFRELEIPRMDTVLRKFVVMKWAEVALVAIGLALVMLNGTLNFPKGLGAGLFIQALIMLLFDFFAEKRGKKYAAFVQNQ